MDAGSIDLVAVWQPAVNRIRVRLVISFSYLLIAALALSAILIAVRRLAGGLEQPLSIASMTAAASLAALLAAGSRVALPSVFSSANHQTPLVVRWAPALLLAIFVAALSMPGTSTAALAVAWGIVAAEELLVGIRFRTVARRNFHPPASPREPEPALAVSRIATLPPTAPLPIAPFNAAPPLLAPQSPPLTSEVVQQQTRSRLANGVDRLSGWLQMSLATGERNATAHIAFCPPFMEVPKISLRQTAGPAGRIRAVQILPHGVRLELKLDLSPRQPQRVSVEFVAETRGG